MKREEIDQLRLKIDLYRKEYLKLPKRDFDQFFATSETSAKKVLIANELGLISNSSVALLGDDDLVSLGMISDNLSFGKLRVFEIDSELANFLKEHSLDRFEVVNYDARTDLNKNDLNRFDLVITDPPYTRSGIDLFLFRAIQLLRKSKTEDQPYIMLYFGAGPRAQEKVIKIQEIINKYDLVIVDKYHDFAEYTGASTVDNKSSLYVLRTTPFTSLEDKLVKTEIYSFEENNEERFPFVDHIVVKVKGINDTVIRSKSSLLKCLGEFIKVHKLKVVDSKETKFGGGGFSFTFILATSNLVVHTWPEHNALHLDLITCSPIYNKEKVISTLSRIFQTKNIELKYIE